MANFGPAVIADKILASFSADHGPADIREIISEICMESGHAETETKAAELVGKWVQKIIFHLSKRVAEFEDVGRQVRVRRVTDDWAYICGAGYPLPRDNVESHEIILRRRHTLNYSATINEISPVQFEKLCTKFLTLLGVETPYQTRLSGDNGIDFYGKLKLSRFLNTANPFPGIEAQLDVWIVGQAKHMVNTKLSTPELRHLYGSVQFGRSNVAPKHDQIGIGLRIADPVYCLLVTTGVFSRDSWYLAKNSGVILMDGQMIAEFLAQKGVGLDSGEFCKNSFYSWLSS